MQTNWTQSIMAWRKPLADAWQLVVDLPCPWMPRGEAAQVEWARIPSDARRTLAALMIGALGIGMVAALLGGVLQLLLGRAAMALTFAVVLTLASLRRTGFRGLTLLSAFFGKYLAGQKLATGTEVPNLLALIALAALQFFGYLTLADTGRCFFAGMVWAAAFAVEGALATLPSSRSGQVFLEIPDAKTLRVLWGGLLGMGLLNLCCGMVVPTVLGIAICWFWCDRLLLRLRETGISSDRITLLGYAAELLLLTLAMCF